MATIEQIRAAQEEIINNFRNQPMRWVPLSEASQPTTTGAVRTSHGGKPRGKRKNTLPAPSKAVEDFIARALGNPTFRHLMERLANE
jgi:hypothetical protein